MTMKLFIICLALMTSIVNMLAQDSSSIVYNPIGILHTDYTKETGAPRQGILIPAGKGSIEIYPEYYQALKGLNMYKYILIFYHLHEVKSWKPMVKPPGSESYFGLFATRTPRRPNPIGFSVVKLKKIENGILYVSGVDAFNGTPVLDIKPYIASIDCVQSKINEDVESKLGLRKKIK